MPNKCQQPQGYGRALGGTRSHYTSKKGLATPFEQKNPSDADRLASETVLISGIDIEIAVDNAASCFESERQHGNSCLSWGGFGKPVEIKLLGIPILYQ